MTRIIGSSKSSTRRLHFHRVNAYTLAEITLPRKLRALTHVWIHSQTMLLNISCALLLKNVKTLKDAASIHYTHYHLHRKTRTHGQAHSTTSTTHRQTDTQTNTHICTYKCAQIYI